MLADTLTSPTTLDIAPDGHVWVAYQDGRIEVIAPDGHGPRLAIQLDCDGSAEHGLQGLELDPDFESNHYLYVYYTANSPTPHNRLSRLTVDPTTENTILPGSEVALLELPDLASYGNPPWHIGGAVQIGLDGSIFVQIGESQQSAQAGDIDSPLGKILHVDPTGRPAANNPFLDEADGITWRDYVWASGLRNPFAGDLDPVSGRYFVCDVGQGAWEEINDATEPGHNFGWPTTEGRFDQQAFPGLTQPFYAYSHATGCAITGGAFNSGGTTTFPAAYRGMFFFSEFCSGEIRMIDPADPGRTSVFATNAEYPMNIEFGPGGELYYIARGAGAGGAPGIGTGSVRRIAFAADVPPSIVASPTDQLASVGYPAQFVAAAAGTAPLEYQWQVATPTGFVDIPGATEHSFVVPAASLADSGSRYRAVVRNPFGVAVTGAASLTVTADTPPRPTIVAPASGATYRAGDTIAFSGGGIDLEDGPLAASQLTWQVDFHHNVHSHPFVESTTGVTGGAFTIPTVTETDSDVFFRITLTAVDSAGLVTQVHRDVIPLTSTFSVLTNLPAGGGGLFVDAHAKVAPFTAVGVEGVVRTLEPPRFQATAAGSVAFVQWLDGETDRGRTIATPANDTAYVALYGRLAGGAVFLSDLAPVGTVVNGWGPMEQDSSNGEQAAGDGRPLTLNGVVYDKGLGVHAPSEVVYALEGRFDRFQADIGIDDENAPGGSAVFRVVVDGVERFSSGTLTNDSATRSIDIDIRGAGELRLVVDPTGDGNGNDHADWADARVLMAGTPLVDINFQAAGAAVPGGYRADSGLAFADRGNGWTYGWSADHTDVSRDRDINPDQRLDTLLHFHAGATWEIALPNGVYEVTATIGDAGFPSTHTLNVEGSPCWTALALDANQFATRTLAVSVSDGRLTLDMGSAPDKSTRITSLRIATPPSGPDLLPFAAADLTLDTRLDATDLVAFAAGWNTDGTARSLEDRVRHGDLDFDGDTDADDFAVLDAAWTGAGNPPLDRAAVLAMVETVVVPAGETTRLSTELTHSTVLVKRGDGVLVLDGANRHTGGTVVESGLVVVRDALALAGGPLEIRSGGEVRLDVGLATVPLSRLWMAPGASVDLGTGGLIVAAGGADAMMLADQLHAGRAGGTWQGASGIRSTAAAMLPGSRGIGSATDPDGSTVLIWTALGDLDLDRDMDSFDLVRMNAGGRYATDQAAGWAQGDADSNGRADVFDLVAMTGAGTFGRGMIVPPAAITAAAGAGGLGHGSALDAARLAVFQQWAIALAWNEAVVATRDKT